MSLKPIGSMFRVYLPTNLPYKPTKCKEIPLSSKYLVSRSLDPQTIPQTVCFESSHTFSSGMTGGFWKTMDIALGMSQEVSKRFVCRTRWNNPLILTIDPNFQRNTQVFPWMQTFKTHPTWGVVTKFSPQRGGGEMSFLEKGPLVIV